MCDIRYIAVILAYPLGFIADKFGRGRVLALSLFGMVLNQTAITVICKPLLAANFFRHAD